MYKNNMSKYKLTNKSIQAFGKTLFQIQATASFGAIVKGEVGGYIESEKNLSQEGNAWVYGDALVYGDAWVYGDALVSGNARVSLKASFTKGWFIGGDDSGKITDITSKTGSTHWTHQYVLGDYEIIPIEEKVEEKSLVDTKVSVTVGGKTYKAKIVE